MVPIQPVQIDNALVKDLANQLMSLLSFKPSDESSQKSWYEQAQICADFIKSNPELSDLVPIRIWQFLSDADIRAADKEYAGAQERLVMKFVSGLHRGVFLSASEIDSEPIAR